METLSLNLRLLELSGIVEPPGVSDGRWKKLLFSMYITTSVFIFLPVLFGEMMAFYHFWGDLVVITNNMFTIVGNITFYGEALYIIARRGAFTRLVQKLEDILQNMPRAGLKQQLIAKESIRRSRALTWSMVIIVYMVPFSWSVAPLISILMPSEGEDMTEKMIQPMDEVEEFWKSLISIMWLPIDATQSPVKEVVYTCQFLVFIITASYYTSVNTVFVSFIVHVAGQFDVLITTITDMDNAVKEERIAHRDPLELQPYFVDVIRHHQTIIAFARELNDLLSPLLFFYFLSAQVMMCVMAFQMVLTWGEQKNFVKFCFGLLCVWAGPFFFCWQGDVLIEKSISAQRAIYGCQWYKRSQSFKSLLLIVIARAQRPLSLTAGKLYIVSLDTFAKMLNTVYYYFAVLKQLHEE